MKLGRKSIVDGKASGLAAEPVAGVVAVSVDEGYLDTAFEEVGQVLEPAWARVIANVVKGGADGGGGRGEVEGDAEGGLNVLFFLIGKYPRLLVNCIFDKAAWLI